MNIDRILNQLWKEGIQHHDIARKSDHAGPWVGVRIDGDKFVWMLVPIAHEQDDKFAKDLAARAKLEREKLKP